MTSAVSGLSAAIYRDEPNAYVATALGSNKDIVFASKNGIANGVEIVVAGSNTLLTVTSSGHVATINSATGPAGAATSTAAEIVAAFNLVAGAFALFGARLAAGQTGAGITGALAETHATNGVASADLALADSGDHLTFQAAAGYRYWSSMSKLEVDVGHDGSWVEQTAGYTANLLRGSITLDVAISAGDLVRATVVRRDGKAFRKVMLLYDGKLKLDGQEIDTSNLDDAGWGSSIMGKKTWEISAGAFYYDGSVPISEIGTRLIAKIYAIYATAKSFVGYGAVLNLENVVASTTDAQKQTITIKGSGEIYPE
jgi:hypothetical protein